MHQANWLHKTHVIGPVLWDAVNTEGIVRHNRKVAHKLRNPEHLPFLNVSDGRLPDEINELTERFHQVCITRSCCCQVMRMTHACTACSAAPTRSGSSRRSSQASASAWRT